MNQIIEKLDCTIGKGYSHLNQLIKQFDRINELFTNYKIRKEQKKELLYPFEIESLFTIAYLNVVIIYKYYLLSKHNIETVYFKKQLCLTIYEFIKTISNPSLNKYFKEHVNEENLNRFKNIKKELSQYNSKLQSIRTSAAHIDFGFIKYYNEHIEVNNLNIDELFSNMFKLVEIIKELNDKMTMKIKENNKRNLLSALDYAMNATFKDDITTISILNQYKDIIQNS